MSPQIDESHLGPHQPGRHRRHQDLAPVTDRHQPGRLIHRRPEEVAVAFDRLTGVDRHAHLDRRRRRPDLDLEGVLHGQRGSNRVTGTPEGHREPVSARGKHEPIVCVNGGVHDGVMACQRRIHILRRRLPQPSRAFEIGEQERHRARRRADPHSQNLPPPTPGSETPSRFRHPGGTPSRSTGEAVRHHFRR
jgi:hypothetical protein